MQRFFILGRDERVYNRHAQVSAGPQHPADLPDRALEVVDVEQRHAGHDQIGAVVSERERRRVGKHYRHRLAGRGRRAD